MINMHVFLTIALLILLIGYVFKLCWRNIFIIIRRLQFAFSLPGPSKLVAITNLLDIVHNRKELLKHVVEITKKYKSPSRLVLGTHTFALLIKPEDYKPLLAKLQGNYKSSVTEDWQTLLGDGIILISGKTHKLRRRTIEHVLNYKRLLGYQYIFNDYANCYADLLEEKIGVCTFNIKPYIARFITDVFLATFVGIRGTAHLGEYDELLNCQERLMKIIYKRSITPWLHFDWVFACTNDAKQMRIGLKYFQDFIQRILQENTMKRHALDNDKSIVMPQESKLVFTEQLLTKFKNKKFSWKDYVDDINNIYFATQNTITETTCFVLLMLAMHTNVQEKLREEILQTFGSDEIDTEHLSKMVYLRMVIQETLRLFPVVPIIERQVTEDVKIESCILPEGTYVMIPIFVIHRNSTYWPDAEKFIPERFSSDRNWSVNAYLPFGTGSRICLGKKYAFQCMKTIIVKLVRRFRLITTINMEDIINDDITNDIMLRCKNGVKLSVFRA